jgi:hypothetical protein
MSRVMTVALTVFLSLFMVSYGPDAYAIQVSPSGAPQSPINDTPPDYNNFIGPIQIEYSETSGPWRKNVEFQYPPP